MTDLGIGVEPRHKVAPPADPSARPAIRAAEILGGTSSDTGNADLLDEWILWQRARGLSVDADPILTP